MKEPAPGAKPTLGNNSPGLIGTQEHQHTRSSPPFPPDVPDHELLRPIGEGSFGEVWLARNKLGTLRAVKIVYRSTFEDSRPFEREFKGIQKFEPISRSHDGLVDILQVGGKDEYFYYVMELADDASGESGKMGERVSENRAPTSHSPTHLPTHSPATYSPRTFRSEVRRRGRLPIAQCLDIGQSLASALAHLHARGLVHRDIKPSNIIFVQGAPKLADIGLVADVSEARSFVGTEGFIPPEGPGAAQADLYSLGKVLYEISTGRDRRDFPALPDDLAEDEAMLELNAVILKACKNDLRERYQSAAEIQADLALLQRGKSVKRQRTVQRRFALGRKISLAAILIILLVTGGYFVTTKLNRRGDGLQQLPAELAAMEGTKNLKAYKKYVQGRTAMRQRNRAGLTEGLKLMREAVDLDPRFVRAWAELYMNYVLGRWENAEANTQMRLIVKRLEELNPNSAEAHFTKGWLASDHFEGEKEFQRAIQLDPSRPYAHSLYAAFLSERGRLHEARKQLDECENLDAGFWMVPDLRGDCFSVERNYPMARAEYEKAITLAHQNIGAFERLGRLYEANHQIVNAIAAFQNAWAFSGEDPEKIAQRYDALSRAFLADGERGYWLKRLEQAEAEQTQEKQPYAFAVLQARLGHKDQALALLEKGWELKDSDLDLLIRDQCWDDLRDNEQFKELLRKMGFRTDWPIK